MSKDELIRKYAEKLEKVYNEQTAGDFTFDGILAQFLREYDKMCDVDEIRYFDQYSTHHDI